MSDQHSETGRASPRGGGVGVGGAETLEALRNVSGLEWSDARRYDMSGDGQMTVDF